jgi:hypothetical protein
MPIDVNYIDFSLDLLLVKIIDRYFGEDIKKIFFRILIT